MISILASLLLGLGAAVVYASERIWIDGTFHGVLHWLGMGLAVTSLIIRVTDWSGAQGVAKIAEKRLLWAHLGVLVAMVFYAVTTDWGMSLLGLSEGIRGETVVKQSWAAVKTVTLVAVFWPALFTVSGLALLFLELAYRRMPVAEAIELRRLSGAAFDGMTIALALVFVVSINYAADKRDIRKDVSYFKTTQPSAGTIQMVKSVNNPVRAILFFPKTNEVLTEVLPYFQALAASSSRFKVEVMDHALAPTLTNKYRVRDNGTVLLLKGDGHAEQPEQLELGTDLGQARPRLKNLDGRFQQAFTTLARMKREIYFTVGHGERSDNSAGVGTPGERTAMLIKALDRANVTTKNLGIKNGLATDVPEGAPAVAVVGPRQPFLPEECAALLRYVQKGGRVVVMVDPSDDNGLAPFLSGIGLRLADGVLASDSKYLTRSHTTADRVIAYSSKFSSHPTVSVVSKHASEAAALFLAGGALLQPTEAAPKGVSVSFPIRSDASFWLDKNGNFTPDPEEKRGVQNMMAAVTVATDEKDAAGKKLDGRVVVIADADFITDQLMGNPGNPAVLSDVLQWLLGQEQIVGAVASEDDVPIQHTREQDKMWFYGTTVGVPLPLFALGAWVAVRRRRARRPTQARGTEGKGA